jgi:hypothetical protein
MIRLPSIPVARCIAAAQEALPTIRQHYAMAQDLAKHKHLPAAQ